MKYADEMPSKYADEMPPKYATEICRRHEAPVTGVFGLLVSPRVVGGFEYTVDGVLQLGCHNRDTELYGHIPLHSPRPMQSEEYFDPKSTSTRPAAW